MIVRPALAQMAVKSCWRARQATEDCESCIVKKSTDIQLPPGWRATVAQTLDEVDAMRSVWRELQRGEDTAVPHADIDRYLTLLRVQRDYSSPHVLLLRNGDEPLALLIGRIESRRLRCRLPGKVRSCLPGWLGERGVPGPRLRRLIVEFGGIPGWSDAEVASVMMQHIMGVLRDGRADCCELLNVPIESPIYEVSQVIPHRFCRNHLLGVQPYRSMSVPSSLEEFYARCSKRHRGNLRRYVRKLNSEHPDEVVTVTYRGNRWDDGLGIAARLSEHTYQIGLGGGLRDDRITRALSENAAMQDWLRLSVLFVAGEPVAFQYGLLYGDCYFLEVIGYHPEWREYNVGTVLFLDVLDSLCQSGEVGTFYFGFGEGDYKRWYGQECSMLGSVSVFAARPVPLVVNALQSAHRRLRNRKRGD